MYASRCTLRKDYLELTQYFLLMARPTLNNLGLWGQPAFLLGFAYGPARGRIEPYKGLAGGACTIYPADGAVA